MDWLEEYIKTGQISSPSDNLTEEKVKNSGLFSSKSFDPYVNGSLTARPDAEVGLGDEFTEGMKANWYGVKSSTKGFASGVAGALGMDALKNYIAKSAEEDRARAAEHTTEFAKKDWELSDVFTPRGLASGIGSMIPSTAVAGAGAVMGTALAPLLGVGSIAGSIIGGTLVGLPLEAGEAYEINREKTGTEDIGSAIIAGIPAAALDVLPLRLVPGSGKIIEKIGSSILSKYATKFGSKMTVSTAKRIASAGVLDAAKTLGKNTSLAAMSEYTQEYLQTILENAPAQFEMGQDWLSDDVLAEAKQAGLRGMSGGVGMGFGAGAYDASSRSREAKGIIARTKAEEEYGDILSQGMPRPQSSLMDDEDYRDVIISQDQEAEQAGEYESFLAQMEQQRVTGDEEGRGGLFGKVRDVRQVQPTGGIFGVAQEPVRFGAFEQPIDQMDEMQLTEEAKRYGVTAFTTNELNAPLPEDPNMLLDIAKRLFYYEWEHRNKAKEPPSVFGVTQKTGPFVDPFAPEPSGMSTHAQLSEDFKKAFADEFNNVSPDRLGEAVKALRMRVAEAQGNNLRMEVAAAREFNKLRDLSAASDAILRGRTSPTEVDLALAQASGRPDLVQALSSLTGDTVYSGVEPMTGPFGTPDRSLSQQEAEEAEKGLDKERQTQQLLEQFKDKSDDDLKREANTIKKFLSTYKKESEAIPQDEQADNIAKQMAQNLKVLLSVARARQEQKVKGQARKKTIFATDAERKKEQRRLSFLSDPYKKFWDSVESYLAGEYPDKYDTPMTRSKEGYPIVAGGITYSGREMPQSGIQRGEVRTQKGFKGRNPNFPVNDFGFLEQEVVMPEEEKTAEQPQPPAQTPPQTTQSQPQKPPSQVPIKSRTELVREDLEKIESEAEELEKNVKFLELSKNNTQRIPVDEALQAKTNGDLLRLVVKYGSNFDQVVAKLFLSTRLPIIYRSVIWKKRSKFAASFSYGLDMSSDELKFEITDIKNKNGLLARDVLHEVVHAHLSRWLSFTFPDGSKELGSYKKAFDVYSRMLRLGTDLNGKNLDPIIKELLRIYILSYTEYESRFGKGSISHASYKRQNWLYMFKNLNEFMAEALSANEARRFLSSITINVNSRDKSVEITLLDKLSTTFKKIINKIFGSKAIFGDQQNPSKAPSVDNALNHVLGISTVLIKKISTGELDINSPNFDIVAFNQRHWPASGQPVTKLLPTMKKLDATNPLARRRVEKMSQAQLGERAEGNRPFVPRREIPEEGKEHTIEESLPVDERKSMYLSEGFGKGKQPKAMFTNWIKDRIEYLRQSILEDRERTGQQYAGALEGAARGILGRNIGNKFVFANLMHRWADGLQWAKVLEKDLQLVHDRVAFVMKNILSSMKTKEDVMDFVNYLRIKNDLWNMSHSKEGEPMESRADFYGLKNAELEKMAADILAKNPSIEEALEQHRKIMEMAKNFYKDKLGFAVQSDNPYYLPDVIADADTMAYWASTKTTNSSYQPFRVGKFHRREGTTLERNKDYFFIMENYLKNYYRDMHIYSFAEKLINKYGKVVPYNTDTEKYDIPDDFAEWRPPRSVGILNRIILDMHDKHPEFLDKIPDKDARKLVRDIILEAKRREQEREPGKGTNQRVFLPKNMVEYLGQVEETYHPWELKVKRLTGLYKSLAINGAGIPFQFMQVMSDSMNVYLVNASAFRNIPDAARAIWHSNKGKVTPENLELVRIKELADKVGASFGIARGENLPTAVTFANVNPNGTKVDAMRNAGLKVLSKLPGVNEYREETWRMALFMEELRDRGIWDGTKLNGEVKDLAENSEVWDAANTTKNAMVSYIEKTKFRKGIVMSGGFLPFIHWSIENTKQLARLAATSPKAWVKVLVPMMMYSMFLGDDDDEKDGSALLGQLPKWMSESGVVIPMPGTYDKDKGEVVVTIVNTPFNDLEQYMKGFWKKLWLATNPAPVKAISEAYIFQREVFTDKPIRYNNRHWKLIGSFFPPAAQLHRLKEKVYDQTPDKIEALKKRSIFGYTPMAGALTFPVYKVNLKESREWRFNDDLRQFVMDVIKDGPGDFKENLKILEKKYGKKLYHKTRDKKIVSEPINNFLFYNNKYRQDFYDVAKKVGYYTPPTAKELKKRKSWLEKK